MPAAPKILQALENGVFPVHLDVLEDLLAY